jgi:hypothetical protein
MRPRARTIALACVLCAAALMLVGCTNPDAQPPSTPGVSSVQNTGEPAAPPPPKAGGQAAVNVQRTPGRALRAFAALYMNWTYQTLAANQQKLAAMAVGAARLTEQQAARAAADSTITRAHLRSSGHLVSIAPDERESGAWVIVTREQTSGSGEYEGLPASYHITIAKLARLTSGYAVQSWESLR